jgi:hypothetical protein
MRYDEFLRLAQGAIDQLRVVPSPLSSVLAPWSDIERSGLWLEFGVYKGESLAKMACVAPLGGGTAKVFGFDSFEGLPEDWNESHPKGTFATPLPVVEGANIVIGKFEDTLPSFVHVMARSPVTLLHVDCDLYSSTSTVLRRVLPHLAPGALVVFDELAGYEGFEKHEMLALWEAHERGFRFEFVCRDPAGTKVAIRSEGFPGGCDELGGEERVRCVVPSCGSQPL